jgi:hypothetical protein
MDAGARKEPMYGIVQARPPISSLFHETKFDEEQMKKAAKSVVSAIALVLLAFITQGLIIQVLVTQGLAQESASQASQRVIVHAGKLLDVRSGKTLTDQAIVIEGGKIVSVGPLAQANRYSGD